MRQDTRRLCELTSAADALGCKGLVDITSRALARLIEGKTPEQIRETFNLPDDLTEEEKLQPLRVGRDDPRIRLLNRLFARKRKELQERRNGGGVALEQPAETRSVDALLEFISGSPANAKGKAKKRKPKKKATKSASLGAADIPGAAAGAGAADGDDASSEEEVAPPVVIDLQQQATLDAEVAAFALRLSAAALEPSGPSSAACSIPPPSQLAPHPVLVVQRLLQEFVAALGLSEQLNITATGAAKQFRGTTEQREARILLPGGTVLLDLSSSFTPTA